MSRATDFASIKIGKTHQMTPSDQNDKYTQPTFGGLRYEPINQKENVAN